MAKVKKSGLSGKKSSGGKVSGNHCLVNLKDVLKAKKLAEEGNGEAFPLIASANIEDCLSVNAVAASHVKYMVCPLKGKKDRRVSFSNSVFP